MATKTQDAMAQSIAAHQRAAGAMIALAAFVRKDRTREADARIFDGLAAEQFAAIEALRPWICDTKSSEATHVDGASRH